VAVYVDDAIWDWQGLKWCHLLADTEEELHRFAQLCSPRGFCAGVVRAIDAVEQALKIYGPPVYVRHEIVHNRYRRREPEGQGRDLRRGARRDSRRPTRR
jgi:hypothetical protein